MHSDYSNAKFQLLNKKSHRLILLSNLVNYVYHQFVDFHRQRVAVLTAINNCLLCSANRPSFPLSFKSYIALLLMVSLVTSYSALVLPLHKIAVVTNPNERDRNSELAILLFPGQLRERDESRLGQRMRRLEKRDNSGMRQSENGKKWKRDCAERRPNVSTITFHAHRPVIVQAFSAYWRCYHQFLFRPLAIYNADATFREVRTSSLTGLNWSTTNIEKRPCGM